MSQSPTVVVLHGLGRTQRSMAGLADFLTSEGYATWTCTYPSRRRDIESLASAIATDIRNDLGASARLVAVTHSLGGLIARAMSDRLHFDAIVMLAPPNAGSALARVLSRMPWFQLLLGPAAQQLAQAANQRIEHGKSTEHRNSCGTVRWPQPHCPVAVIAGTLSPSIGNPTSWLTSGLKTFGESAENDGTVTVNETRLPVMSEFHKVPASHTWIMDHPRARQLTLEFLHRSVPNPSKIGRQAEKTH